MWCWPGVGEQTMGGRWGQPADIAVQSGCFSFISSNRPAKVDKGFKNKTKQKQRLVRKMGNFVRLFCSMHTNIQAQILHSVEPTDQPVLVHIWMLCCKCHRGQGCGVSERHLLWVPQQGLLCFGGDLGDYISGSWHTKALRCHRD